MKLNKKGLIGTTIYHVLLILLLVFAGLTFPDPPPEEEGILVNFGTDDTGFGREEPGGITETEEPEPVVEEEEYVEPESTPPDTYTPPEPEVADQTQDVEEVQVKEEPTPEELQKQREEAERIERERIERERIEQERLEQERIEREQREEQERIEREQREKAERLKNMGQGAFEGSGTGDGSEGIAGGDGNQGDPDGGDSDNYGTGDGLGNNGIGFGLEGRGSRSLPLPNVAGCEVTQKITVTVDIQVDRNGNVVQATVQKATYQDKCIWDMVVEAAKKSRFTANQAAAYRQTGWIRYIISP